MRRDREGVLLFVLILVQFSADSLSQPEIPDWKPPVTSFMIPEELWLCGEEIPLERQDVRERLEREFYYTLDKEGQIALYVKRAARCQPVVEELLEEAGVPDDLKYVPVAESGLIFRARSGAGAVGYWQFMKGTALRYGLRVDRYVDERRDLARSTKAAIAYLKDLRAEFGSWALALAAYNWGERSVARSVEDQGVDSYFDLYIPDETDRFVFRVAVLKLLLDNPQGHAIYVSEENLYRQPEIEEAVVSAASWLSVDVLSEAAGVPPRTFRHLNEWMNASSLPAGEYTFSVPRGMANGYPETVTRMMNEKGRIVHVVRRGEHLTFIANKYGVTVTDIERWNSISRHRPILPGQKLVIVGGG
jgi:hypothetical protein